MVDGKQLMTNMIIAVVTVGLSLVVIIYTSNIAGPIPISVSQTSSEINRPFSVTGKSELTVTPDQLSVNVGIESTADTVVEAKDNVNNINDAILNSMLELGVEKEDIKTTNFSVRPNHDYRSEENNITDYTVTSSMTIKTQELDTLNQIIDSATANGANRISGVSFTISPEKEQDLLKEARKIAIDDAKRNAEELAHLSGMKLGKVVNVVENSPYRPVPMAYDEMMPMAAGMAEDSVKTNVQPGESSYSYEVSVSYETR